MKSRRPSSSWIIVTFLEWNTFPESEALLSYTDFSDLTEIRLSFGHVCHTAQRRQKGRPWRSAFFAPSIISFAIAQLSSEMMLLAPIQVRAFRERDVAAEWLGVPQGGRCQAG